uniref:Iron hydrogenase large subunit C-terminal domain-containing protein n=1 Tax=Lotharella globosa TaxID=91324 RepID=A0A7S3Z1C8_9EUKA
MAESKCPYHYVEVMACPGGCANGGGQPRPSQSQGGDDSLGRFGSQREAVMAQRRLYATQPVALPEDTLRNLSATQPSPAAAVVASEKDKWRAGVLADGDEDEEGLHLKEVERKKASKRDLLEW